MSYMLQEIFEQPAVLAGIEKKNDAALTGLVAALRQTPPKHIVIAARGTSDHCGIYIKYLSEIILGLPVTLAAPSVHTVYSAAVHYESALVIGISQSGMAADALAVLEHANACGAITAAVTNNTESPLALTARYCLDCAAGPEKSLAATKTFTAEMYCLTLLIARWSGNEELKDVWRALPQTLARAGEIAELAKTFADMEQCFVLGRGLLYPVALEMALKLAETCYVNARGFAASDFWHGPIALITRHTPVFVLCGADEANGDMQAVAEQCARFGADVVLITDQEEQDGAPYPVRSLCAPSDRYAAPFHFTLFAQLFAAALAEAKGIDPDAPRNLKKVTITR